MAQKKKVQNNGKSKPYVLALIVFLVLIAIIVASSFFNKIMPLQDENETNNTQVNLNQTQSRNTSTNTSQQPRQIDISTGPSSGSGSSGRSSSGGSSSGGSSSTATSSAPQPVQQSEIITIRRNFDDEDTQIITGSSSNNIYQFVVNTPDRLTFTQMYFNLKFENYVDDAAMYAFRNAKLDVQKLNQGNWQTVMTTTLTNYVRSDIYPIYFSSNMPIEIQNGDQFRLVISNVPCELDSPPNSNSISLSMLDFRNRTTMNFITSRNITFLEPEISTDIQDCTLAYNPVGEALWLRFEEPGGTLHDSSGKQNHAFDPFGITYRTEGRIDRWGIYFTGTDNYVQMDTSTSLDFSDPITIEMFIYPKKLNAWQGLIGEGNGIDNYNLLVALTPNNKIGFYTEQGNLWYEGSTTILLAQWKHLVVTVGNCNVVNNIHTDCDVRVFLNGVEETLTGLNGANISPGPTDVNLGAPMAQSSKVLGSWPGSLPRLYPYKGIMDNVVIYPRALTPNEIALKYNSYGFN